MTHNEFDRLLGIIEKDCNQVMASKGLDYSNSKDRLIQFKKEAEKLEISPLFVWNIYFSKGLSAIEYAIRNEGCVNSENLYGRFIDAINYLKLGWALFEDRINEKEDDYKAPFIKEAEEKERENQIKDKEELDLGSGLKIGSEKINWVKDTCYWSNNDILLYIVDVNKETKNLLVFDCTLRRILSFDSNGILLPGIETGEMKTCWIEKCVKPEELPHRRKYCLTLMKGAGLC